MSAETLKGPRCILNSEDFQGLVLIEDQAYSHSCLTASCKDQPITKWLDFPASPSNGGRGGGLESLEHIQIFSFLLDIPFSLPEAKLREVKEDPLWCLGISKRRKCGWLLFCAFLTYSPFLLSKSNPPKLKFFWQGTHPLSVNHDGSRPVCHFFPICQGWVYGWSCDLVMWLQVLHGPQRLPDKSQHCTKRSFGPLLLQIVSNGCFCVQANASSWVLQFG